MRIGLVGWRFQTVTGCNAASRQVRLFHHPNLVVFLSPLAFSHPKTGFSSPQFSTATTHSRMPGDSGWGNLNKPPYTFISVEELAALLKSPDRQLLDLIIIDVRVSSLPWFVVGFAHRLAVPLLFCLQRTLILLCVRTPGFSCLSYHEALV